MKTACWRRREGSKQKLGDPFQCSVEGKSRGNDTHLTDGWCINVSSRYYRLIRRITYRNSVEVGRKASPELAMASQSRAHKPRYPTRYPQSSLPPSHSCWAPAALCWLGVAITVQFLYRGDLGDDVSPHGGVWRGRGCTGCDDGPLGRFRVPAAVDSAQDLHALR